MAQRSAADADVSDDTDEADGGPGDPEAVARIVCLRLLDRRARTRAELAAALSKRGVPDDAAVRVLDRFVEVGLIDDVAYAARFTAARHGERGLAPRAISQQLRQRGVDQEIIAEAVGEIDRDSELATAHRLVEARLRRMSALDPMVQARRLTGMLARKGYSPSIAGEVVRQAIRAMPDLT